MIQTWIGRPESLKFLSDWKDEDVIKVVSGVRRCGKSTLFAMFREKLISEGISPEQIIAINFEDFAFEDLRNPRNLYQHIKDRVTGSRRYYIFLDEIQNVENYERVVNSFQLNKNIDLYITGSNAYFLSGELATLLSGRYVELKMLPLSFKEFLSAQKQNDLPLKALYSKYLQTSFPYAAGLEGIKKRQYLEGIYSTVVLKDIVTRLNIGDVALLQLIIRYLYAGTGSFLNINKITNTIVSMGGKISNKTVDRYIEGIENSMLIYRANRYNVKGRKLFSANVKYYAVDNGLRQLIAGDRLEDYGHILENIIYLELIRRGYLVYVGVVDNMEVDFMAKKGENEVLYIQVAYNTENEDTLARELRPLQAIKDNHPKLLLTMDEVLPEQNFAGIIKTNALEWLII